MLARVKILGSYIILSVLANLYASRLDYQTCRVLGSMLATVKILGSYIILTVCPCEWICQQARL